MLLLELERTGGSYESHAWVRSPRPEIDTLGGKWLGKSISSLLILTFSSWLTAAEYKTLLLTGAALAAIHTPFH